MLLKFFKFFKKYYIIEALKTPGKVIKILQNSSQVLSLSQIISGFFCLFFLLEKSELSEKVFNSCISISFSKIISFVQIKNESSILSQDFIPVQVLLYISLVTWTIIVYFRVFLSIPLGNFFKDLEKIEINH